MTSKGLIQQDIEKEGAEDNSFSFPVLDPRPSVLFKPKKLAKTLRNGGKRFGNHEQHPDSGGRQGLNGPVARRLPRDHYLGLRWDSTPIWTPKESRPSQQLLGLWISSKFSCGSKCLGQQVQSSKHSSIWKSGFHSSSLTEQSSFPLKCLLSVSKNEEDPSNFITNQSRSMPNNR